jgi:photosystem II stability/assembly factor-like uncharacterized protein
MVLLKKTCGFAMIVTAAVVLANLQAVQAAGSSDQVAGDLTYEPQIGALYKSEGQALYRRDGRAKQWSTVPFAAQSGSAKVVSIAFSAGEQNQLYVAGPGIGVLKSANAGMTWEHIDRGLPSRNVTAFTTHSTVPDTIFAVVTGEGIYRSEDGGGQWRMVDKGPEAEIRRLIHSNLEGSMQSGWLFAATDKGVYRSMDCFCGWRTAGNLTGPVSAVAYDPKQPMELFASVGQQLFRTENGGEEWKMMGTAGAEITALTYSPTGILHALLSDGGVVQSQDKGQRWQ